MKTDPVMLNKSARANGEIMGKQCAKYLRLRLAATRKQQKLKRISDAEKIARVNDFTKVLKKTAPDWLEEVAGLAAGAKVKAEDILYLNCLPVGFYQPGGNNCTSFIRIGKKENWLFKIRDERNHIQQFGIRQNGKLLRLQYGVDIGNLGVAHSFNSAAVAGANDTGSRTKLVGESVSLNDCHVLRWLSERACNVGEVPGLFEKLLATGFVGGAGKERGMILLFADPERGLVLESAGENFATRFIEKGTYVVSNHFLLPEAKKWQSAAPDINTTKRKTRMEELLKKAGASLSPLDVFAISRDRKHAPHSLCNDDLKHFWMTISTQLAIINRASPEESVNFVCCGNTRQSVFLPVPLARIANDPRALGGDFYARADRLYRRDGCAGGLAKTQKSFEREAMLDTQADWWGEAYKVLGRD
jgi:hypothetical protein